MPGKVYIASMNMRGKRAIAPNGAICINVTSAQAKQNENRKDFSPMTEIVGGYKGYWNFESYWQSGKVFEGISEEITKAWWKSLKEPKRRYPGAKNMKVLYAKFDDIDGKLDYVTSRKKVYVPEYYNLIKNRKMTKHWKKIIKKATDIVIYDFDGPRKTDKNCVGDVTCLELTKELLIKKINDEKFPFGHGYVVGACLLGIDYEEFIK
jgi:hypothetical protein